MINVSILFLGLAALDILGGNPKSGERCGGENDGEPLNFDSSPAWAIPAQRTNSRLFYSLPIRNSDGKWNQAFKWKIISLFCIHGTGAFST